MEKKYHKKVEKNKMKPPENVVTNEVFKPFQKINSDKIAEILISKLVIISAKYLVIDLPKYPNMEPKSGKNNIAYSI